MKKLTFEIRSPAHQQNAIHAVQQILPDPTKPIVVIIQERNRSLDQNRKLWACLGDVSRQVEWHGRWLDAESWKCVFNQLAKDLEIMFENYVEGFEAACVVSRSAKKFRPGDTAMQRAGDVLYRPQHYHMNIEEGLDLSGKTPTALVQRLVPSVFKEPKNILYTLDAREMRDPEHKTEAGRAAGMRLAAQIDSDLISMVTQRATNVITMADSTTGSQGRDLWNCAAGIDATMTAIGVPQGINRRSFWNPFNYKDLAGELGHRAYAQGATLTAYEKAQIPPVASFDSYKTDISGRVPKGTATSITLAAAPAHKVEAKDANDMPVDT
ncbi:recombination protein NinB [Escherichia coli]|nr:recombination protein NinB [Escherichia coli]ELQ5584655.1 recombination protein NinB [Escherichia coli]